MTDRREFLRAAKSVRPGEAWPGPTVDQAEGCRLMGIPNDCFIRWGNKPAFKEYGRTARTGGVSRKFVE